MDKMRITGGEARALLNGVAPGPWVLSYDDRYNAVCIDDRDGCEILYDEGPIEPHHKLFAAAPDLAAAVIALEEERDEALAEVERLRRLSERRAEERHEQEARAIRAERERHDAARSRDEAVFAREAAASQHRQDLLAIANALGCTDSAPASLVAAARLAAHPRTGGAS